MSNKLQNAVQGVRGFFGDVGLEMKKVTWPERQELIGSTVVVIVSVLLISAFVGLSDKALMVLLRLVMPGR